ncbi:MAG: hypothetical protein ACRDNS_06410, partial [Trebonia sp.]
MLLQTAEDHTLTACRLNQAIPQRLQIRRRRGVRRAHANARFGWLAESRSARNCRAAACRSVP